MEGTIEGLSPKRTKTCMNISSFVKGTSFLENPRRVPIVCYIFLRILPLNFLLAKKKKKKLIILMKVHYAGHVSRISTGEMEGYVGQICSMRSQENSFSSQAVNAV